jgi:hypothetical protein
VSELPKIKLGPALVGDLIPPLTPKTSATAKGGIRNAIPISCCLFNFAATDSTIGRSPAKAMLRFMSKPGLPAVNQLRLTR